MPSSFNKPGDLPLHFSDPDGSPDSPEQFTSRIKSSNRGTARWPWRTAQHRRYQPRGTRKLVQILKYALVSTLVLLLYLFYKYEPHIELAFYSRTWVTEEILSVAMAPGDGDGGSCFDPSRLSPAYNVSTSIYGPKRSEVQAGMMMRFGLDCYDFAGTIKETAREERPPLGTPGTVWEDERRVPFHTYWRADLRKFGERQEALLKSFFATQDLERTKLVLWSNGDLLTGSGNDVLLRTYQEKYPEQFELRVVDIARLARGTELDGNVLLQNVHDKRAWVDGDLVRLLVLWNHGGVWVDMDSLLTRDLEPLLEHEFVTQWDCYDKKYSALNGALMRFRKHSPYLCETFRTIKESRPPRPGSTDWGSILYLKSWRRLVASGIPPFKILPFCFNDGRSCRIDNRLPDPFAPDHKSGKWTMGLGMEEGGPLDQVLHKIFCVHLHNQWEKAFPSGGWVERLLLKRFDEDRTG